MPIFKRAPRRKIGHWLPYYFNNSRRGLRRTKRHKVKWHDFDVALSLEGTWWVNHGLPEKVYFSRELRFFSDRQVSMARHRSFKILRPKPLFKLAKRWKINVEIDPKGLDRRYHDVTQWVKLARLCEQIWGVNWPEHTYVKVGPANGTKWAIKTIKAASEAGFNAGPTRKWNITDADLRD